MQYINVSERPHTAPLFLAVCSCVCVFVCPLLRIHNLETELNK